MKLSVDRFTYEPPGLALIPETDLEAAILNKYWETATLTKGMGSSGDKSADGFSYGIKFNFEQNMARMRQQQMLDRQTDAQQFGDLLILG